MNASVPIASIPLDELADIANPHRKAIAIALKAAHDTATAGGDPVFADAVIALHTVLGAADTAIVGIVNRDSNQRAQPEDGGGGDSKNPN